MCNPPPTHRLPPRWGHGDLRATTRQAFQLHGVLKSNLKDVIKVTPGPRP
jgi:sulfite reductase beta subunit-like hemoprotein